MKLRDYQDVAVNAIFEYFETNERPGFPLVLMPTGTGKSPVIGDFIRQALMKFPSTRIMKLTHVKELVEQNLDKLKKIWPAAPVGVYSSGLKRKDIGFPIVYGGVATVARASLEGFGRIDILIVDEGHLISPNDETMYRKIIAGLLAINPYMKVIGFTATGYRQGQGLLTEGDNRLFTDVAIDMTTKEYFNWFFAVGWLKRIIPKPTKTKFDISNVHIRGGEYVEKELQEVFDDDKLTEAAVRECILEAGDRKHWLVFATGIEHTINVAAMLNYFGISATFVHSDKKRMSENERDRNIADFKAGKYQAMVNNGILTTGFDFPAIDMIVVLRATRSTSLWVQMLGRGTRPVYADGFDLSDAIERVMAILASECPNCLVLDFARNAVRLGPINNPVLPKPKGKGPPGDAPVKICPGCGCYNHASARICEFCGFEFPIALKIDATASTAELIESSEDEPLVIEIFKVDKVVYTRSQSQDKPPHIKADYYCGYRMFTERVCLEHGGYAAMKAREWWQTNSILPEASPPITTTEALQSLDLLKTPTHINVWVKKKHSKIMNYDFTGTAFATEVLDAPL